MWPGVRVNGRFLRDPCSTLLGIVMIPVYLVCEKRELRQS